MTTALSKEKFFMIYSPQGFQDSKHFKTEHEAYEASLAMIEKYPNQKFYVMEALTLIKANVEIKSFQLTAKQRAEDII